MRFELVLENSELSGTYSDPTIICLIFRESVSLLTVFSVIGNHLYAIEGWWMKLVCVALALASLVLPVGFFILKYQRRKLGKRIYG